MSSGSSLFFVVRGDGRFIPPVSLPVPRENVPRASTPKTRARHATNKPTTVRPSTGKAIDFDAYRTAQPEPVERKREPKDEAETAARAKRDRANWENLAYIDGLSVVDQFSDVNEQYGPYQACLVRMPARGSNPTMDVLVITNEETRAGKVVASEESSGKFDMLDGSGDHWVPVSVRVKKSRLHPDGRPMVLLTFDEVR